MMDLTLENGCEVEYQRDSKGRTWMPMDAHAKKERKWIPMQDLGKKKEWTWISMEAER